MNASSARTLRVCWLKPAAPPDESDIVLSFLSPSIEQEIRDSFRCPVLSAREASLQVRTLARDLYIDLVARIGIVDSGSGETFRRSICPTGETSPWWYHRVTFKDCEADPIFEWIVAVLTIRQVAKQHGLDRLLLAHSPHPVAQALKSEFVVEEIQSTKGRSLASIFLRGLAARAKYVVTAIRQRRAIVRHTTLPRSTFEVALCGFWDWSVSWDERTGQLIDRYFKQLPDELIAAGASTGWFAWFDPHAEPDKQGRALTRVLTPMAQRKDVVLLQSFLSAGDILSAIIGIRPLLGVLKIHRRRELRQKLTYENLDFYALFAELLLVDFAGPSIPHHRLVALATERCFRRYQPKVAVTFLEHFPHSRAQYAGIRRAETETVCLIVQHATYSHEKTFLFLHPSLEFEGEPDGVKAPHGDYVCAMGSWAQKLFLECGYEPDTVYLTGSPRYDHVGKSLDQISPESSEGQVSVLIVCGLDTTLELEMVDAVCAATQGLSGVTLSLRNHPFRRIESEPRFAAYRDQIHLTHGSLEEDLSRADLILFTYSTVAEEAFLAGKPVWQWLTLHANGSALAEVANIPQFGTVASLRNALREFLADPTKFYPPAKARAQALEKLFYKADGGAAKRAAAFCVAQLTARETTRVVQVK